MSKFILIAVALSVSQMACMPEPPVRPEFGPPTGAPPAGPGQPTPDDPPSAAADPVPEPGALPEGLSGQDVLDALGARGLDGISEEEASHYAATFARLDTDGDGEMTEQEFVDGGFFPEEQARRIFAASDIDQDGVTTEEEYVEHRAVTDEAKLIHADLDADGDGALTLDELVAAVDLDAATEVFASADPDDDGAITMIEFLRAVGEWTWSDRR